MLANYPLSNLCKLLVAPYWWLVEKSYMREDKKQGPAPGVDPALSTPSEANREKHINYLDDERKHENHDEKALKDRQKQWREGIQGDERGNTPDDIY
jgi:hypothetical protein